MAYKSISTIKDSPLRANIRKRITELGYTLPNASAIYDFGLVSILEQALATHSDSRVINRIRIAEALQNEYYQ